MLLNPFGTYDLHIRPLCAPLIFLRKPKPHSPPRITNGDSYFEAFADSEVGGGVGVAHIRSEVVDMIDFENFKRSC